MITIYRKKADTALEIYTEPTDGCWINVVDPTPDEITRLQALGIPQDYITYALDVDESPRTERENGDLFILLRVPYFQGKKADIPYTTIPLGIILSHELIVTVSKIESDVIQEFTNGRAKNLSTGKRNRFVLRLLLGTANRYLGHLREITKIVELLEDELQQSTRNKEVLELLKYQKSLTYFTTALKANELMLERLQRSQLFKAYPDDIDLLEDVITENQQAIEMTNIQTNILNGLMDAFASIISNNLNGIMKFLASITIVISLPTMVASFFGMNVNVPLGEHPIGFLVILGISIVMSSTAALIFYKRDWF
jgi:magnesium transporter